MAWRGEQTVLNQGGYVATSASNFLGSQAAPGETLPGGWHPTIAYLIGFSVVELVAYHLLSKHLNIK